MQVTVYKSLRKSETYVYLKSDDATDTLPDGLSRLLGDLQEVLTVELSSERKLALADPVEVMRQLDAQGYYVQMPSSEGLPV